MASTEEVDESTLKNLHTSFKTQKERFGFLLGNTEKSDVVFVVGEKPRQKKIPAHRFLLTVGSPIFDSMFNGQAEQFCVENNEIAIPDIEEDVFHELLRFLYQEQVEIDNSLTVVGLMYSSKKYMISELTERCLEYFKNKLSAANVCIILTQSILFDEEELAKRCLELIDEYAAEVFVSEDFLNLEQKTLNLLLDRDTLRIDEKKVFDAVNLWSEFQCRKKEIVPNPENKREVLGKALYLVRMSLLSPEEFTTGPLASDIVNAEESVEILANFHRKDKSKTHFAEGKRAVPVDIYTICLRKIEPSIANINTAVVKVRGAVKVVKEMMYIASALSFIKNVIDMLRKGLSYVADYL